MSKTTRKGVSNVAGPPKAGENLKPRAKTPEQQSKQRPLVLLDWGLEAVRLLTSAQEGSYDRRLFSVLEEIGLAKPLTDIWKWQDQEICEEFIRNWDHKVKKTTVFGISIDAGLSYFSFATGLDADPMTSPSPTYAGQHATRELCEKFCGADQDQEKSGKTQPRSCNSVTNTLSTDLLLFLNKTLWFANRNETRVFKTLVFLLVKALEGRNYGWGRCVHDRFVASMHHQLQYSGQDPDGGTLAGPLMCFLFAHARHKTLLCPQVFQNDRVERVHTTETVSKEGRYGPICAANKVCGMVSCGANLDLPTACLNKKRAYEDFTGVESSFSDSSASLPGQPRSKASVVPSSADKPSKRQCLGTFPDLDNLSVTSREALDLTSKVKELEEYMDRKEKEISRLLLVEANYEAQVKRLQVLYAEEQKHVQDCLKSRFDSVVAEEEASELRAKVKALTDMYRESSRRETFLELQLADLRRRWDIEFSLRTKSSQEVCNMTDVTLRLKTGR